jgi:hypothetical protein
LRAFMRESREQGRGRGQEDVVVPGAGRPRQLAAGQRTSGHGNHQMPPPGRGTERDVGCESRRTSMENDHHHPPSGNNTHHTVHDKHPSTSHSTIDYGSIGAEGAYESSPAAPCTAEACHRASRFAVMINREHVAYRAATLGRSPTCPATKKPAMKKMTTARVCS